MGLEHPLHGPMLLVIELLQTRGEIISYKLVGRLY